MFEFDSEKVNVGDKVIYKSRNFERIATVIKVTPTGRIRIDYKNLQFDKYGEMMGNKNAWIHPRIYKATEKDMERIKHEMVINKAYRLCVEVNPKKITYEKAVKIIEILGDKNNE